MLVCTKNSGFSHQYVIYSVTFSDSFFFQDELVTEVTFERFFYVFLYFQLFLADGPGNCINGCGFGKASIGSEWKLRHDVEQLRYLAR